MKTTANMEDLATLAPVMTGKSSGNVIALSDSADRPLNALTLCGKSTQSKTTGAQLLDTRKFNDMTISGITFAKKPDGSIKVSGTATASTMTNFIYVNLTAGTYSISGGTKVWCYIIKSDGTKNYYYNKSFTVDGTEKSVGIYIQIPANETINTTVYPMLNAGDTALPWEPYTGGKASPNPDYPQDITSVGSSITASVCGKNLAVINTSGNNVYIGYLVKNAKYTLCFEQDEATGFNIWVKPESGSNITITSKHNSEAGTKVTISFTSPSDGKLFFDGYQTKNQRNFMLTAGESTEFIEFVPPDMQSIALSAPNGLRGIPVTSDGNYTDENGQQWICDTIELGSDGTGKLVQRTAFVRDFSGTADMSRWAGVKNTVANFRIYIPNEVSEKNCSFCTHLNLNSRTWSSDVIGHYCLEAGSVDITLPYDILGITSDATYTERQDACGAWIEAQKSAGTPLTFLLLLAEPVETPLTAEEIAAFEALHTNYPATTIFNDAGTGQSVEYSIDTKTYIDNIRDEFMNAILSTGGNV